MKLTNALAVAVLAAGVPAIAYFGFIEYPKARAANIAKAEACIEAKGVDCEEINMATLEKSAPELHEQLEGIELSEAPASVPPVVLPAEEAK